MKTDQECYDEVLTLMSNMMVDNVRLIKMPPIRLTLEQLERLSNVPSFIPETVSEHEGEVVSP